MWSPRPTEHGWCSQRSVCRRSFRHGGAVTAPFTQGSLWPGAGRGAGRRGHRPPRNMDGAASGVSAGDPSVSLRLTASFAQGSLWPGEGRGRGAGGHVGPPLREDGESDEPTGLVFAAVWRRGVEDAAPYGVPAGGGVRLGCGFLEGRTAGRSPPPTRVSESACGGPKYLRHGFRRANFGREFGAAVMGIGPCGGRRG